MGKRQIYRPKPTRKELEQSFRLLDPRGRSFQEVLAERLRNMPEQAGALPGERELEKSEARPRSALRGVGG